jgi:hypothetical protein
LLSSFEMIKAKMLTQSAFEVVCLFDNGHMYDCVTTGRYTCSLKYKANFTTSLHEIKITR